LGNQLQIYLKFKPANHNWLWCQIKYKGTVENYFIAEATSVTTNGFKGPGSYALCVTPTLYSDDTSIIIGKQN
jgi:hypothetical protein